MAVLGKIRRRGVLLVSIIGLGLFAVQQLQVQLVGIAELHTAIERVGHVHRLGEVFICLCRILRIGSIGTARNAYHQGHHNQIQEVVKSVLHIVSLCKCAVKLRNIPDNLCTSHYFLTTFNTPLRLSFLSLVELAPHIKRLSILSENLSILSEIEKNRNFSCS